MVVYSSAPYNVVKSAGILVDDIIAELVANIQVCVFLCVVYYLYVLMLCLTVLLHMDQFLFFCLICK